MPRAISRAVSRAGIAGLACLLLLATACFDVGGAVPDAAPIPDAAPWADGGEGPIIDVLIVALRFDPVDITVPRGATVRWTNYDAVPHTVTEGAPGAPGTPVFDSPLLPVGASFEWTFYDAGEWIYYCRTHPMVMRDSKVIVQ